MRLFIILTTVVAVSIIVIGITSCNKKKKDDKSSEIKTDIKGISWLINSPYQPQAVWYQVTRLGTPDTPLAPGPNDYIYCAVLLFEKKDVEAILKQSDTERSRNLSVTGIFAAAPETSNLLKEHGTLEEKVYDASPLLNNGGSMVRIKGTDKLFISYATR